MTPITEIKPQAISAIEYFKAKIAYEMTSWTLKSMVVDKKTTDCGFRSTDVWLLDVRSPTSYAEGHLPTAINIPLAQLAEKLGTLPKDKTIVTYCSTLTCALAPKAALMLAEKGFKVMELSGGIATWNEYGFPIEKTA